MDIGDLFLHYYLLFIVPNFRLHAAISSFLRLLALARSLYIFLERAKEAV